MNPNMNPMYMNMNPQMKMNMCPMNMMMNQFQMMMMNNNNLNDLSQFSNCPTMESFMNYKYYNLRNQYPLNDGNLSQTEKNLSIFFDCICDFNKNINNFGTKIYINYYNLEKIELYLDLSLQVKYLVSIIFGLILSESNKRNYYIRMKKNQTTKQIIQNPINFYGSDSLYKNTIYLEFNNIDLNQLSEKTGFEIGLKKGDELLLKLKKDYYNELETLKIDNIIKFKDYRDNNIIYFQSFKEEIVSDMLKRFTKFINADYYKCSFILNAEDLKNNSKKIKDVLEQDSFIDFYYTFLIGGLEFKLADVSKEKIKNLKFSKTAPVWRKVKEGLNIFGFCKNKGCTTYKKEVVYIPEKMDIKDNYFKLNIIEERENMKCPICNSLIKAKTIGFYKCEYQIIGRKINEEGKLIEYDSKPKETKDDNFEYFSPDENGEVEWTKLFVYVLPKQKIKYQSNQ